MTRFSFLHAADIHLDSPLHGLSRYEGVPADEVRGATRSAFENLISAALEQEVDFVILAGDVFDGDWKDMGTGLYFSRALGRLDRAGIPVFLLNGNHDAASVLTKALSLPPNVRVFNSRKPQTFVLDEIGVALHGRSFPTAHVNDNLAQEYPKPSPNRFNIGVLHTAVGGFANHAPYAPCSVPELVSKAYDYWALGHVHEHQVLHQSPWIVFPGNLQGRHIRETGAKGAVLVEVADGVVSAVQHLPLDVLRWIRVEVGCAGLATFDEMLAAVRAALTAAYEASSAGQPAVARIVLNGETPLHGVLRNSPARLRDEIRAVASHIASELWIEKVAVQTAASRTRTTGALPREDFAALLDEAIADPDLAAALATDLAPILAAAPEDEAPPESGPLAFARAKDWSGVLTTGVEALAARLSEEAG